MSAKFYFLTKIFEKTLVENNDLIEILELEGRIKVEEFLHKKKSFNKLTQR